VRPFGFAFLAAASILVFSTLSPTASHAGENSEKSKSEQLQDRARVLREQSTDAARSRVGYETVEVPTTATAPDTYYALTLQIERLAEMVRAFRTAEERRRTADNWAGSTLPAPPFSGSPAQISKVYGPGGPTERSVRLLLEYRLMVTGNPRLKVGRVVDQNDHVSAQIVTLDGSLVDEFAVDKKTGLWQPVR